MTRNRRLQSVADAANTAGAERHGEYWLTANLIALGVLDDLDLKARKPLMAAFTALLTLRLLDLTRPVGITAEPTPETIKSVLNTLNPLPAVETNAISADYVSAISTQLTSAYESAISARPVSVDPRERRPASTTLSLDNYIALGDIVSEEEKE